MEGATLAFTDEALHEGARLASMKGTGARGLRAVLETVMLEPLFHLPSLPKGGEYLVTPEIVRGEAALAEEPKRKSA